MKIQRYTAASMREALARIRAEQGEEAVILSTRRLEEGVEVVSAVDYDAALIGDVARQSAPAAAAALAEPPPLRVIRAADPPEPEQAQYLDEEWTDERCLDEVSTDEVSTDEVRKDAVSAHGVYAHGVYTQLQSELKDMRLLLESELAVLGWKNQRQQDPLSARVLEELSALDIAPDVTLTLAQNMPRRTTAKNPQHIPLALLVKYLPMIDDTTCTEGGVVAVVGPTGVGKTTTIAKLAARWCLRHGSQDLALVSTDGYRIGARDQLLTYARILDAPMHVADGGAELSKVLQRLKHKRLVLIDTAGMSQRDLRIPEQLDALRSGLGKARVLLAVPAGGEARAVDEIVRAYGRIVPDACVLTKIDEAASLGAALSAVLRRDLPIAYLCDGQRVPEDLHDAQAKRLWLVRKALALKDESKPFKDEGYLARNFGRVQSHA